MIIGRRPGAIASAGGLRIEQTRSYGVTYLLRDEFTTDEAAPLASPRTCEPGPGTITFSDATNTSITGGKLYINNVTNSNFLTSLVSLGITPTNGFAASIINTWKGGQSNFGFSSGGLPLLMSVQLSDVTTTGYRVRLPANIYLINPLVIDSYYRLSIVYRSPGGFFIRQKDGGDTVLEWIDNDVVASTHIGVGGNSTIREYFDEYRWFQLGTPWDTDYGIATQRLAGARSPGDTYTHEANHIGELEIDTIPAAGEIEDWFRSPTVGTDGWRYAINSSGDIRFDEVVAGAPTQRGISLGVIANSDRVVEISDDETIRLYEANTLRITYAGAVTNKTATNGEIETLGTGGTVSEKITWPRTLSGSALSELNKYV